MFISNLNKIKQKIGIDKTCPICQKIFYTPPCLSWVKTCSRKCCGISRLGKPSPKKGQKGLQIAWNKGTKVFVKSVCPFCRKEFKHPKFQKRKYCSFECYIKNNIGENNWRWKKDRTGIDLNKRRHWSSECKKWRTTIFTRDNYKCRISNEDCCAYIEAHHILSWKSHPELRFNINNGITLCRVHHPRKRAEEKRLSPYFQELVAVSKV